MRTFLALLVLVFACISSVAAGGHYYNVSFNTTTTIICPTTPAPFVNVTKTTRTHPVLATSTGPVTFVSRANLNTVSPVQGAVGLVMSVFVLAVAQYVW